MNKVKAIAIAVLFLINSFIFPNPISAQTNVAAKRLSIGIEANAMKVTSNLNFRSAGLNGSFHIDYHITDNMYAGLYLTKMRDWYQRENQLFLIDGKVIDLSTSQFTNYGLSCGYRLMLENRFYCSPEIRLGYGTYNAKSANFSQNNAQNTLDVNMWTLYPRAKFGYTLTKCIDAGITWGYFIPFGFSQRTNLNEYNLNNVVAGVFIQANL